MKKIFCELRINIFPYIKYHVDASFLYIFFNSIVLFLTANRDDIFALNKENENIGKLIPNKNFFKVKFYNK